MQDICPPDLRKVPGAWQDHYVPGRGGIPPEDWELLCSTLEEINFRGIAVFEIHPLAVLEEVFRARRFFDGQLADEGSGGARAVRAAKPTVKIARRQRGR